MAGAEEALRMAPNFSGSLPNSSFGTAIDQLREENQKQREDQANMNALRVQGIEEQGNFYKNILPSLVSNYRSGKDYARRESSEEQQAQERNLGMQRTQSDLQRAQEDRAFQNEVQGNGKTRRQQQYDTEQEQAAVGIKSAKIANTAANLGIDATKYSAAVAKYRAASLTGDPAMLSNLDRELAAQGLTPTQIQAAKADASRPDFAAQALAQSVKDATPEGAASRKLKDKASTYKTALTQMDEAQKAYEQNTRFGGVVDTAKASDATHQFAEALRAIGKNSQADSVEASFAQRLASGDIGKTRASVMDSAKKGVAHELQADLGASAASAGKYAHDPELEDAYDYAHKIANDSPQGGKNQVSPTTGMPASYGGAKPSWSQPNNGNPFRGAPQQPGPYQGAMQPAGAGQGQIPMGGPMPNVQAPVQQQPMQQFNPNSFQTGQ